MEKEMQKYQFSIGNSVSMIFNFSLKTNHLEELYLTILYTIKNNSLLVIFIELLVKRIIMLKYASELGFDAKYTGKNFYKPQ